jgi:outer membrane protein OmpU
MNNLKKIGLTALGTALVTAGSAQAAGLSVSAATSITFVGNEGTATGNGWNMTDSISFDASGEMDNGFTVSTNLELDGSALDDRSITIDTGDMGSLTFSGSGGSGPIGAWDDITPSANEESWNGYTGTRSMTADASSKDIFIFDYTAMDGLAIKAALTPSDGATAVESSIEYGALYTGIDGLSVYAAIGENNDQVATSTTLTGKADLSMFGVTYAMGAITVGYQMNEVDSGTANEDTDATMIGISYAVSDDLSVSINQSEVDIENKTEHQEATSVSFSYTSGGMTISGTHGSMDNIGGTATSDESQYELNFGFAF